MKAHNFLRENKFSGTVFELQREFQNLDRI